MTPIIPQSMLDKHPERVQVAAALAAYRAGKCVSVPCKVCGEGLIVEEFAEVGALVVTCPCGATHYRTRWTPTKKSTASGHHEGIKPSALSDDNS